MLPTGQYRMVEAGLFAGTHLSARTYASMKAVIGEYNLVCVFLPLFFF